MRHRLHGKLEWFRNYEYPPFHEAKPGAILTVIIHENTCDYLLITYRDL